MKSSILKADKKAAIALANKSEAMRTPKGNKIFDVKIEAKVITISGPLKKDGEWIKDEAGKPKRDNLLFKWEKLPAGQIIWWEPEFITIEEGE